MLGRKRQLSYSGILVADCFQASEFEVQPQLKQFRDAWRAFKAKFNCLCLVLILKKKSVDCLQPYIQNSRNW